MQRLDNTRHRKQIRLSQYSIDMLNEFAAHHGLNFGQTIERLALIGLQDTKSIGIAELVTATVKSEMRRQFNRFAKLSAMSAIEAGTTKEMVMSVYWYLLLNEYGNYAESLEKDELPSFNEFESMFKVSADSAPGKIIGTMMKKRGEIARYKSVKSLRTGLDFLHDLMREMDTWEADNGTEATAQEDPA